MRAAVGNRHRTGALKLYNDVRMSKINRNPGPILARRRSLDGARDSHLASGIRQLRQACLLAQQHCRGSFKTIHLQVFFSSPRSFPGQAHRTILCDGRASNVLGHKFCLEWPRKRCCGSMHAKRTHSVLPIRFYVEN